MSKDAMYEHQVGRDSVRVRIDFVIVVAVEVERDSVLEVLQPLHREAKPLKVFCGDTVYYVGKIGNYGCAVVMCQMGATGRNSSILATSDAIAEWHPTVGVVMPGIAFGRYKPRRGASRPKQVLGDVLVATQVIPYEQERIGTREVVPRGAHPEPSLQLTNRLANLEWSWTTPEGDTRGLKFGPLLSGEKLIDDPTTKKRLFRTHKKAIGGEMEGAGVYAACARNRIEWVIFKAICDWGDGMKKNDHQASAAANATSVLGALLSEPGLVEEDGRSRESSRFARAKPPAKADEAAQAAGPPHGLDHLHKFGADEIEAIVSAAMRAGLAEPERRRLLLQSLPSAIRGALPILARPRDQLQSDVEVLCTLGSNPGEPSAISVWLERAAYLAQPFADASVLRDFVRPCAPQDSTGDDEHQERPPAKPS